MEQIDLLRYVLTMLERLGIPYMLVGSLSSGIYGEPRMTRDIDIVIQLKPGDVDGMVTAFHPDEFYVSREAVLGALTHHSQFNVIHPTSGNKIDFIISRADAWGNAQMERRRRAWILPDLEGYLASPEDVVIGKMLYYKEGGSDKHLRDIAGILKVSSKMIDADYLSHWANELGLGDIWKAVSAQAGGRSRED